MATVGNNPEEYLASLPVEGREDMAAIRQTILKNIPEGFCEVISHGVLAYMVPHSLYPAGYHCNPNEPLPFISLALRKNFIALYHMGIYADKDLLEWFRTEYPKHSKRNLDMGKSCIRFKKTKDVPYLLIGELVSKMTPHQWIRLYEAQVM